jgi:ubiquinone/menaquinone biosynthesis C-methylase UbiE
MTDRLIQQQAWNSRYLMKGRQWGNAPGEFANLSTHGIVLELGVGDGKNLRIRRDGSLVIGLDFSREAVRICRSDPALSGIPLIIGDGSLLPIKTENISLIHAHHILGHIPSEDVCTFISEMYRVLVPGGRAAITVFGSGDMRDGHGDEIEPGLYLRGDGIITRYFSQLNLKQLLSAFVVEEISQETWDMRIRGILHQRRILLARIRKPD